MASYAEILTDQRQYEKKESEHLETFKLKDFNQVSLCYFMFPFDLTRTSVYSFPVSLSEVKELLLIQREAIHQVHLFVASYPWSSYMLLVDYIWLAY